MELAIPVGVCKLNVCPRHVPELKLQFAYTCLSSHLKYCADAEKMQLCWCQGQAVTWTLAAQQLSPALSQSGAILELRQLLYTFVSCSCLPGQASELQGILLQHCEEHCGSLFCACTHRYQPLRRAEIMVQASTAFRVQPVQSMVFL